MSSITPSPCPPADVLARHARGELPDPEGERVRDHLATCRACTSAVAGLEGTLPSAFRHQGLVEGARVGQYVIEGVLGMGGMGAVYAARDTVLERRVALKLLHGEPGEWARTFLLREAQAMAKLSHPNVVTVYELGERAEGFFLAMELVDGTSLAEWLAQAPRRPEEIVARFVEAGRGLEAAHAAGVVHRDFKPENVLVGRDGRARVTDFGISRLPPAAETAGAPKATLTGRRAGTPAYMAPEQLSGAAVDARADLYSFCLALIESLTGKPLFPSVETEARLAAMRTPAVPDALPPAARSAVARGLSFDPEARQSSITPLLDALGARPSRHRWPLWAALALGLGGASLLAWQVVRPPAPAAAPAAPSAEPPWLEEEPLELRVGDQLPFSVPGLKRVAVGAPEVLDLRPTAPAAFLLTAVAPGETSLMSWTPTERRRRRVTVRPAR